MKILAYDIGGVYIKSALIEYIDGNVKILSVKRNAFNFRIHAQNLKQALSVELASHISENEFDGIAITITAETVGIFKTIREGVIRISEICENLFQQYDVGYVSTDGKLHPFCDVKVEPYNFASANWVATSELATEYIYNGFIIDMGSTTTDIIPIKNGRIVPNGKTDFTRLISGELIYNGLLRTYIQCVVDKLPYKDKWINLASEIRCFTAHIYVYLGLIEEHKMLHPFSGKEMSVTKNNSKDAIARSVCADSELLTDEDIKIMAQYVLDTQIKCIGQSIKNIWEKKWNQDEDIKFIIVGSGECIVRMAIEELGLGKNILDCSKIKDLDNATAIALAYKMKDFIFHQGDQGNT